MGKLETELVRDIFFYDYEKNRNPEKVSHQISDSETVLAYVLVP